MTTLTAAGVSFKVVSELFGHLEYAVWDGHWKREIQRVT